MNNSIQSTQDAIIDYSKKQGLNYSERQIDQMVINDLEYRSKLNGDAYRYNTEFIDKSAETSARQYLTNFENSGGIVRVYDGKKTKSLKAYDKDIKDYKTFEDTSNFKFNGIIPVNPNLGNKPSYEFIAREGSKTLRVSIPAMNIESTMSTPRILLNKINQGIIKPTEVQTDRGILTIVPTIQNDFIQYYIKETDRNGRERTSTIEDYLVNGIMDVGMKYFGDGVTRSEARKSSE